jgi:hypothetical protein
MATNSDTGGEYQKENYYKIEYTPIDTTTEPDTTILPFIKIVKSTEGDKNTEENDHIIEISIVGDLITDKYKILTSPPSSGPTE